MKKFIKILLYILVLPPLLLLLLFSSVAWFYRISYANRNNIGAVSWEDTMPLNKNIPVRFVDTKEIFTNGCRITDRAGYRYLFRIDPDDPNKYWVTLFRLEFGGLIACTARYQITDPEIERQLIELYRKQQHEESLRILQEENRAKTKRVPDSIKNPES